MDADTAPPLVTTTLDETNGTLSLGFPRGPLASNLGIEPILQSSLNLAFWQDRPDALRSTVPWTSGLEWMELTVPLPDEDPAPSRFFIRFRLP